MKATVYIVTTKVNLWN